MAHRRAASEPRAPATVQEPAPLSAAAIAALSVAEALAALGSSRTGLEDAEVAARRRELGPNVLPRQPRRAWYLELAENFVHLMALLLWVAAVLAWLGGMPELAWAIVAVVLLNGAFSYVQQYEAERAIDALEALLPRQVTVRRANRIAQIAASDVVPGDVLVLSEGAAIPADARLIEAQRLRVDAAALTGESRPLARRAEPSDPAGRQAIDLPNVVFAGTAIATGTGEAVVFATVGRTEFGRIARLTQVQAARPGPLQREMLRVTRVISALAVLLGVAFFALGTLVKGLSPLEGFLFAVGIIVANVPEGLLPTITLALAMAVRRMAGRRALVRQLAKVEALGATTVIVTDKTGTLTENEMTVREAWVAERTFRFSGAGYDVHGTIEAARDDEEGGRLLRELLRTAALCCDAHLAEPKEDAGPIGDPTEIAILVAAAKAGLSSTVLAGWPRLGEVPFDSVRKRMTTLQLVDGVTVACVKGAPSEVLARCTRVRSTHGTMRLDERLRGVIEAENDRLVRRAMRTLAVAMRPLDAGARDGREWDADAVERDLTLLGLLAMEDPPRPEVPRAIRSCREAGVRVLMATGDDPRTAGAIGRQIGLYDGSPRIVTGRELDAMDDSQLARLLQDAQPMFARVAPEHKLRLVETLQGLGEVVAVTGDGVNDAPALKRAEVGVAMGATGTDVAREAADLVLTDDDFASVVAAIEEGRAIYDNLRKFMTYILASNVPEIVPFVAFVLLDIPLPLTVMQILAVDLGTDLAPALALGADPPERDVMRRPPRSRSERLLDARTLARAYLWLGPLEAALGMLAFFYAYWLAGFAPWAALPASGEPYRTATTMSLAGIVACQVGNAFACRSAHESVRRIGLRGNRLLILGISLEVGLLLAFIYVAPLAHVFGLAPLDARHWALLIAFPAVIVLLEELRKAAVRGRGCE
jgi:magnesium-transporting ATPase (P-type)